MITALIVWEALRRFYQPQPVTGGLMLGIAVVGLLANLLSFWLLHHGSEEKNLNVRATALHVHVMANLLSFWLLHHGSEEKNLNVRATALHVHVITMRCYSASTNICTRSTRLVMPQCRWSTSRAPRLTANWAMIMTQRLGITTIITANRRTITDAIR